MKMKTVAWWVAMGVASSLVGCGGDGDGPVDVNGAYSVTQTSQVWNRSRGPYGYVDITVRASGTVRGPVGALVLATPMIYGTYSHTFVVNSWSRPTGDNARYAQEQSLPGDAFERGPDDPETTTWTYEAHMQYDLGNKAAIDLFAANQWHSSRGQVVLEAPADW